MRKPKWYNWTGDADWDEYCLVGCTIMGACIFLFLLVFGAAFYNTFVRHI